MALAALIFALASSVQVCFELASESFALVSALMFSFEIAIFLQDSSLNLYAPPPDVRLKPCGDMQLWISIHFDSAWLSSSRSQSSRIDVENAFHPCFAMVWPKRILHLPFACCDQRNFISTLWPTYFRPVAVCVIR